ncbi:hypothetical protein DFP73DRAFT_636575 [Morchella snyderi]|nr:hypothetical protein DFP73DRAFT_636575 [Morchella snyderi]
MNGDTKLLLVAMPTTPGKIALPGKGAADSKVLAVASKALESPSGSQVLRELETYNSVHFAYHGIPDNRSPSNSHLQLLGHDKKTGEKIIDRLTVGAIASKRVTDGQIAYLPACSTAVNSVENLANESLHMASGFQLAGFSHIFATLWRSNGITSRR